MQDQFARIVNSGLRRRVTCILIAKLNTMASYKLLLLGTVIAILWQEATGLCFQKFCSSNPSNRGRGCDSQGCGHYGAPRGSRTHKGVDIKCGEGDTVYAPFPSKYLRVSRPYGPSHKHFSKAFNTGIFLQGTGSWKNYQAKIFYVSPVSGTFKAGDKIGTFQKLPYPGMTQHVHIALYKKKGSKYLITDPTSYIC